MVNEPRAEEVESKTQQEPVPSSDQKTSESEAVETKVTPVTEEEPKLPEDAKERTTQQFEKLRKELATERERRIKMEKSFQTPTQQPKQKLSEDWYNQDTGEVNVDLLRKRETATEAELKQLKQTVRNVQQQSEAQQERVAFKAYPELNPSGDTFNEDFHDAVSGFLLNQYSKGKQPSFKEAADRMAKFAGKTTDKAKKAGAKEALEQITEKEQGSLEAIGRSDRRLPETNVADLKARTRLGGDAGIQAAMQRLKNVKPVGK